MDDGLLVNECRLRGVHCSRASYLTVPARNANDGCFIGIGRLEDVNLVVII